MVTIENIRDLERYLLDRFSDEPTVNVRIVSGGSLGDAVAVEVIPDTPYGCPWVALFGLTFDYHGRVDGIMGAAYDHWDPKNSGSLRWEDNYDKYIGWLPACGPNRVFGTHGLNIFMGRVFGSLYHPEQTRTRNSLA